MLIQIKGEPISRKANRGAAADSERAWQKEIARQTEGLPIVSKPQAATIMFRVHNWNIHGPDLDNLLKPLFDGLKETVFNSPVEDSVIYMMNVGKKPASTPEEAGVDIYLY